MKKTLIIATLMTLLFGCSKKGKQESGPDFIPAPDKTILVTPASNSTCTIGRLISSAQSAVTFSWNQATNAESYDLNVRDLLSGKTLTQSTTATQLEVILSRNTPYTWYITAKTTKTTSTTQSDSWKFYNSGVAATNYAPFPADLISPAFNQSVTALSGKIALTWNGSDVDNDIQGYDIYLGTTLAGMFIVKTNQPTTTLDIMVTSGTIYYWKVVTRDSQGNISISDTNQFFVN